MLPNIKNLIQDRRQFIISFLPVLGFAPLAIGQGRNPNPRPEKVRDPVCGIPVLKDPQLSADYKDRTYYFCSNADRDKFKQNPPKYV